MSAIAPVQPAPTLRTPRLSYGGQAVLEGVMMRGRAFMAVAVRAPDKRIVVTSEPLPRHLYGGVIQKIPLVRGVTMLWDALGLGMKALMFSADIQMQGEEADTTNSVRSSEPASLSKPLAWTTVALALIFGIGIFFVTPLAVVGFAEQFVGAHTIWSNLAEGLIRLALLVGYVALIGLMPDVRRVYAYHGAEHMTIHAWEHNDPLDPEHVAHYSPAHPRCGTAFLLEVVAISIVLFALLGTPDLWLRILSRVLLIPVIAGIAYELLRLGGKYPNSPLLKLVIAPGLLLQALTTRYPDATQMEVAIASMRELLRRENETDPLETRPNAEDVVSP
ncbi:MAG TPA: DUF1385 domain-containing protein [Chloroflexota bacterium]|nr:DUF1385 domain-containing protein [Chloroflexota bacterium]